MGENGEGVDPNDVGELVDEERKLREAAHGQQTLENQGSPGMRRGREVRPDGIDGLPLLQREGIQGLGERVSTLCTDERSGNYAPAGA